MQPRAWLLPLLAVACEAQVLPPNPRLYRNDDTPLVPFSTDCMRDITWLDARCDCDTNLKGVHIKIYTNDEDPCETGDRLIAPAAGVPANIRVVTDAGNPCEVVLEGRGTVEEYLGVVNLFEFATTAMDGAPRTLTYWLGHGHYNPATGHYYSHYTVDDMNGNNPDGIRYDAAGSGWGRDHSLGRWMDGQFFCGHPDQDMLGLVGYLATVSDQPEFSFLESDIDGRGFLGGADIQVNDDWRWLTGPEGCPAAYNTDATTDPLLRSGCDLGTVPDGSKNVPCDSAGCLAAQADPANQMGTQFWGGGSAGAGGAKVGGADVYVPFIEDRRADNGVGYPDDNDQIRYAWLRTEDRRDGTGLMYNDAVHAVRAAEYFICEWGGVGTMCIDPEELKHKEKLYFVIDECIEVCPTCEKGKCDTGVPPQECNDPAQDSHHLDDWTCACVAPAGAASTPAWDLGEQDLATDCPFDECVHGDGFLQCVDPLSQPCNDADQGLAPASLGMFVCTCPAGQTGDQGTGGPAMNCVIDECAAGNAGAVECADQDCEDMHQLPTETGDFVCKCTGDYTGEAEGMYAACEIDECMYDMDDCPPDQACDDSATTSALGNYVCTCPPTFTGSQMGGPALVCTKDECAPGELGDTTCTAEQICDDYNEETTGTFTCTCTGLGYSGNATDAKAECDFNQCEAGLTAICEAGDNFGPGRLQTCVEVSLRDDMDAYCACPSPATNTLEGAAADCDWDECTEAAKRMTCEVDPPQECNDDAHPNSLGDWVCRCIHPQVLKSGETVGVGGPSVCETLPGDCFMNVLCSGGDPAQTCNPGTNVHDGDFTCECPMHYDTIKVGDGGLATCEMDECEKPCAGCENDACDALTPDTLTCVEPSKTTVGDWYCLCDVPYSGQSEPAGVPPTDATQPCTIDECAETCPHCAGSTCPAEQDCVDPDADRKVFENWYCACRTPQTPVDPTVRAVMAQAVCKLDECFTHAPDCLPQRCEDLDTSIPGGDDWECVCDYPSTTREEANAVTCLWNECTDVASGRTGDEVCTVDQTCEDTDLSTANTFVCHCKDPEEGSSTGPAYYTGCQLDECAKACDTCADKNDGAGNVCTAAGQECHDPETSAASTGDWKCLCVDATSGVVLADATGVPVGHPTPACPTVNECVNAVPGSAAQSGKHVPRYTADGCLCKMNWHYSSCGSNGISCHGAGTPGEDGCDGCCNPDGDLGGEWCFADTDTNFNLAKMMCNAALHPSVDVDHGHAVWGHCIPVGHTPDGGGLAAPYLPYNRPHNEHIPDDVTNMCHEAVPPQSCIDGPGTGDWRCECLPELTPVDPTATTTQAHVDCELDECVAHGSVCDLAPPVGSQECVDMQKGHDQLDDWICRCVADTTVTGTPAMGCPLDECTVENNADCPTCAYHADVALDICKSEGGDNQECIDPQPFADKVNDWRCECIGDWKGSKPQAAVTPCRIDECTAEVNALCPTCAGLPGNTNLCEQAGTEPAQKCRENGQKKLNNWECVCDFPSARTYPAHAGTSCPVDECADRNGTNVCFYAPGGEQDCFDHDHETDDDWICACKGDYHGEATKGPATCQYDECSNTTNYHLCHDEGQICHDVDNTTDSDWECQCKNDEEVGPPATMAVANCTGTGECLVEANHQVCADQGQVCYDDPATPLITGNWECHCVLPFSGAPGTGNMPSTDCQVDECDSSVADCPSCHVDHCTLHNQVCRDDDHFTLDDWVCDCVAPQTLAPGATQPAKTATTCELDECTRSDVAPNGQTVCTGTGADVPQDCEDLRKDPDDIGSWVCKCGGDSVDSAGQNRVEFCTVNECDLTGNAVCAMEGQICVEHSETVPGDWECHCPAGGASHHAPMGTVDPALCSAYNECITVCDTCPDTGDGAGHACTNAEQTCVDGDDLAAKGNWVCECKAPSQGTGAMGAGAATNCVLDECVEHCDTCATMLGATTKCDAAGQPQHCEDPNTSAGALKDWLCVCEAPLDFLSNTADIALCSFDECLDVLDGESMPPGQVACGGQQCTDTHQTTMGDFLCSCMDPETGDATGHAANCLLNECELAVNLNQCETATPRQDCFDPTSDTRDDWMCLCLEPLGTTDRQKGGAVPVCTLDECKVQEKARECRMATPQQHCHDGDHTKVDDWVCECMGDLTAVSPPAPTTQAQCELDECTAACSTCANGKCASAGQDCNDPDKAPTATYNWVCACKAPSTDTAQQWSVDQCTYDECTDAANVQTCEGASPAAQRCEDRYLTSEGNWECVCPDASVRQTKMPAVCPVDECDTPAHAEVCTSKGQLCRDDGAGDMLNNWECHCALSTGVNPGLMAPAACAMGECSVDANEQVCLSANPPQECVDPDETEADNWVCMCVGDLTGAPVVMNKATCVTDDPCDTAAALGVCEAGGQLCTAVDGTWGCACKFPYAGTSAREGLAACAYDECRKHADVCDDRISVCVDTDLAHDNTWQCNCTGSTNFVPLAAVHDCDAPSTPGLDECLNATNRAVCEIGHPPQECVDEDPALNNWECHCYLASGLGMTWHVMERYPSCDLVGECHDDLISAVCEAEGQFCHDPDTSTPNDWECLCTGLEHGAPGMQKPAECGNNECPIWHCDNGADCPFRRCQEQGQHCYDPDHGVEGDYMCVGGDGGSPRGGGGDDDDDCGSFLACYWWLILLLLLVCSSCCVAALFVIKKRQDEDRNVDDPERVGWEKAAAGENAADGEMEDLQGEETPRSEFKGGDRSDANRSLLHGEQSEGPVGDDSEI